MTKAYNLRAQLKHLLAPGIVADEIKKTGLRLGAYNHERGYYVFHIPEIPGKATPYPAAVIQRERDTEWYLTLMHTKDPQYKEWHVKIRSQLAIPPEKEVPEMGMPTPVCHAKLTKTIAGSDGQGD